MPRRGLRGALLLSERSGKRQAQRRPEHRLRLALALGHRALLHPEAVARRALGERQPPTPSYEVGAGQHREIGSSRQDLLANTNPFALVVVGMFGFGALRAGLRNVPFQGWRFRRISKNTFEDDEEPKLPDTPWF